MTTQRRLTRPGPFDNQFMVTTCTPDGTSVEFFEHEEDAIVAARANLHPSVTTYVGKVIKQGEHAVRGTAGHIALLAEVGQELRNILRKQYGATNRKQIAATLQAMLDGQLAAMRKVHRGEETDHELTQPGIAAPKCARGRVCSNPPCYPDCTDFEGSGHPVAPPVIRCHPGQLMANDETKAKMVALLALLDVLKGDAQMTAVGADKVGSNDAHGRGGKVRLKFTVFGDDARLMRLAVELTELGSNEAIMLRMERALDRDDKLRMAARMIETWSEVMRRLLDERSLEAGVEVLPSGQRSLPSAYCRPGKPCINWPACDCLQTMRLPP